MWVGSEAGDLLLYQPAKPQTNILILYLNNTWQGRWTPGPSSRAGRGQCVVFLGKTLYSHSASLHPSVKMALLALVTESYKGSIVFQIASLKVIAAAIR